VGQPTGVVDAHDPSTVILSNSTYYYYADGQGIATRTSTDGVTWASGTPIFATQPSWISTVVPGFTGYFWAPDVMFRNNLYYMYYSASIFGTKTSAIGLATSASLNPADATYGWTDQGALVQSSGGSNFNAIDPSIMQADTGRVWMSYGSFNNGIFVTEMDPTTGKRLAGGQNVNVANHSTIEGSAIIQHGGFYYLFVNWGGCCAGIDSGYEIHVGRSASPTGPFLDRNGVNMLSGGGTLFVADDGNRVGPGHFAAATVNGQEKYSYHYYDGNRNGAAIFGLSGLYWTADNWPSVAAINPDWSGSASSNWSSASNWSSGQTPNGTGSVANFRSVLAGNYVVHLDTPQTVSRVNFQSSASYTVGDNGGNALTLSKMADDPAATINVADGSHVIAAPVTTTNDVGVNVKPVASNITLSGGLTAGNLRKYGHGSLTLSGTTNLSGEVATHAGSIRIMGTLVTGANLTAGNIVGDQGTVTVAGTANVSVARDLNVGDTGDSVTPATGTLNINDTAAVTIGSAGAFAVGSGFFANTAAVGTVNQTGGSLTANGNFDGAFIVGGRGSSLAVGTYNLSGGTVTSNTNVRIGGYGQGTMNQSGGLFQSGSFVSIGRYTGAQGAWNISAGQLNVTNAARWLIVGEQGQGTLSLSGTGQVTTSGVIRVGHTGGTGTINLHGGAMTTAAIQRGTGTANINFDGGTLKPNAATTAFMQGLSIALVQTGGAIIDTNGFNIQIAQPLLHDTSLGSVLDGGLKKAGNGTLTLSAANSYSGLTDVQAGTLLMNGSLAGGATVENGAILGGTGTIAGGVSVLSGGSIAPGSGIGTFNVTGNDSLAGLFKVEYNSTTIDLLNIGGQFDVSLGSLDFSALATLSTTRSYVFATYGSLVGNSFLSITHQPVTHYIDYHYSGNSIALVPVPEPAACCLIVLGSLCFLARTSLGKRAGKGDQN
jgi:autotransporter-associated beta strand protein